MLKVVENAHWVALISVVIILAVVDAFLYGIDFGNLMIDLICSNDMLTQVWGFIGLTAWMASIVLGGACTGALLGRGWRRYR